MITIPGQIIKMDVETGIEPVWYDKFKVLFASSNLFAADAGTSSRITASLGADVALTNIAVYFDGPSIAQGSVGTWWVFGTVTVTDTAGAALFRARLTDGTTIIASCAEDIRVATVNRAISLSGFIASPAGNLKIQVLDATSGSGKIVFNASGNAKDSTISAFRIA